MRRRRNSGTDSQKRLYPTVTSMTVGVRPPTDVASCTRYCTNCELAPIDAPEVGIVTKLVQDASGTEVFPVRTLTMRLVPEGSAAVHEAFAHVTMLPASMMRDTKVAGVI